MTLIVCTDCGRSISSKAPQCIHCGCPIAEQSATPGPIPNQPSEPPRKPEASDASAAPAPAPTTATTPTSDATVSVAHLAGIPFEVIAAFLQKRKNPRVRAVKYLAGEIEISGSFTTLVRARLIDTSLHLDAAVKWRWYLFTALIPWAIIRAMIESGQVRLGALGTFLLLGALFAITHVLWRAMGLGAHAQRATRDALVTALADRAPLEAEHQALREAIDRRHKQMGISTSPRT